MQRDQPPLPDMAELVLDASALVDVLLGNSIGRAVRNRVGGNGLHAPAHIDAESLSAFGRLHRAGDLSSSEVDAMLADLAAAPIQRHALAPLLPGAWSRRDRLRLVDSLYVELAETLRLPLVTTDTRLHAEPSVEVVRS